MYRPLLVYCALCVVLSWGCWLPLALAGTAPSGLSPLKYLHLLGGLGPAISGLICAWLFGGLPALNTLLRRIGCWRVAMKWHVVEWLGPFVLLAISLAIASRWGQGGVRGMLTGSTEFTELTLPIYWLNVLVFYGFGEEIGWRGFALPVLQNHFSALTSTLILSVIWGTWHLPLFWFSPGLSSMNIGGVIGWYFSLLTGAIILTWLINGARGSIFLAAVLHATMDLAFSPSQSPLVTTLMGAMVTLTGIGVLISTRALSRNPSTRLILRVPSEGALQRS